MKHLRRNMDGFSALEVAFIVICMGLVGGSGYYVYTQQYEETPPPTTTTITQEPANVEPLSTEQTKDWASFISQKYSYALKLPDGWKVDYFKPDDELRSMDVAYKAGTPATVTTINDSYVGDSWFKFSVWQGDRSDAGQHLKDHDSSEDFTAGTLTGTKYYKKYTAADDVEGFVSRAGTEEYLYEFTTGNTTTFISYVVQAEHLTDKETGKTTVNKDSNFVDVVDDAVKTLNIKR